MDHQSFNVVTAPATLGGFTGLPQGGMDMNAQLPFSLNLAGRGGGGSANWEHTPLANGGKAGLDPLTPWIIDPEPENVPWPTLLDPSATKPGLLGLKGSKTGLLQIRNELESTLVELLKSCCCTGTVGTGLTQDRVDRPPLDEPAAAAPTVTGMTRPAADIKPAWLGPFDASLPLNSGPAPKYCGVIGENNALRSRPAELPAPIRMERPKDAIGAGRAGRIHGCAALFPEQPALNGLLPGCTTGGKQAKKHSSEGATEGKQRADNAKVRALTQYQQEDMESAKISTVAMSPELQAAREQAAVGGGLSGYTTVMVRHIPYRYPLQKLLRDINSAGFEGSYDFFYLPSATRKCSNRGFAFINFVHPEIAESFYWTFQGKRLFHVDTERFVTVMPADVQGFEENAVHYAASCAKSHKFVPHTKPLFFRPLPACLRGEGAAAARN